VILSLLRALPTSVKTFTRESLAAYFGLPSLLFTQRGATGPIVFHQGGAIVPVSYQIRGAIFWPADKHVIPGIPQAMPSSDHTLESAAAHNDRLFISFLVDGEAVIETREPGIAVRLYHHAGKPYFATHSTSDGHDPLLGAGIENVRSLGLDIAGQARRLCDAMCPKAYRLAAQGYVLVFVLLLPERITLPAADRPDLVLVDVIDPDYEFVDRLEKERIAQDHGLNLVAQHGRLNGIASPAEYFGRLRALELTAAQSDSPGYIVKAVNDDGERICVVAEPSSARSWPQQFDLFDLKAAYETIHEDFRGTMLPLTLLEELMLEYLGTRRRAVRWQVAEWIAQL